MRISRLYQNQALVMGKPLLLEAKTAHYLVHVLRHKVGHRLILFNGDGTQYEGAIVSIRKLVVEVVLDQQQKCPAESRLYIHLAQVMSKADRMDYALQKACELGVNEITPLSSKYCDIRLDETRMTRKLEHWTQVLQSAAEQSGRGLVPKLNHNRTLNQWLGDSFEGSRLIFDPRAAVSLKSSNLDQHIRIIIGPEGGFSEDEVEASRLAHYQAMRLGPRILRTETATVAALSCLQFLAGDLDLPRNAEQAV